LEETGNDMAGRKTRFLALPAPVRVVVRALVFNRIVRHRRFFKARTNRAMNPEAGPPSAAQAGSRLREALAALEVAVHACAVEGDTIRSVVFGRVTLEDYVVFQELHVRHHRAQLPGAIAQRFGPALR
jgi:hypothetical protein